MNPYYLLMYTVVTGLLAYSLARMFFGRAADRGMSASQMLFAGLLWFVLMLGLLFYERYLKFLI
jgi:hypothetical protein